MTCLQCRIPPADLLPNIPLVQILPGSSCYWWWPGELAVALEQCISRDAFIALLLQFSLNAVWYSLSWVHFVGIMPYAEQA